METTNYQQYLTHEFARRLERNPRYSLRAFAKAIGMDIAALSQILNGKRLLSLKKAEHILKVLELNIEEREMFLTSLAQDHQLKKKKIDSKVLRILGTVKSQQKVKNLATEQFAMISEWYHAAILELTFVSHFESDPTWIAKKLNITKMEATLAIKRLLELELLEIKDGRLLKTSQRLITVDRHMTSAALKKRQKQVIEKSLFSLENDPIEKRNHSAMTMAIDPALIPEAKKRIDTFLNEMAQFLETGNQQIVYEMTFNLFPLQREN
ncbi:MAG: TIGR02147 family protein [Bacteriovoracaceae bacterium]